MCAQIFQPQIRISLVFLEPRKKVRHYSRLVTTIGLTRTKATWLHFFSAKIQKAVGLGLLLFRFPLQIQRQLWKGCILPRRLVAGEVGFEAFALASQQLLFQSSVSTSQNGHTRQLVVSSKRRARCRSREPYIK